MEIINKNFIKLDKFFITQQIIISSENKDSKKLDFFTNLFTAIINYQHSNRTNIDYIYISINDLKNDNIFKITDLPISRQSIINATLFAILNGDLDKIQELKKYFFKQKTYKSEMPKLFNYVLEHSMDINEYMDKEKIRFIYKEKESKLEKGYIYSQDNQPKKLTLNR